jgi:hypothetical protein
MARPNFFPAAAPAQTDPQSTSPVAREIDRVADRLGFVDRMPAPTVRAKKRKTVEDPQCSFTMRISVRDANRFVEWTEGQGISYRQGFEHLMKLLDKYPEEAAKR